MEFLTQNLGIIVTVVIFALARIIPNKKIYASGKFIGSWLTLKLNKFKWWQKIEDWLIDGISQLIDGFIDGLRRDNKADHNG